VEDRRDAEYLGRGALGVERQCLRQVTERSVAADRPDGWQVFTGDQFEQRALARAVGATRPVRPSPTAKDSPSNCGVSPGQEKDRFEQTMEVSDM
jgi:hypothetical protein